MEKADRDEQIDHVWLQIDVGRRLHVEASINTRSIKNARAGFDARIRAGVCRKPWTTLPERGVRALATFDYAAVESVRNVFYETLDRPQMESLLLEKARAAVRIEVWGMPYHRRQPGIHQIHSRRASCAVPTDVRGQDGGVRFYFDHPRECETWFFKFCGQP